eukprot:scaffold2551_cov113-Cylindrotheca_fusiformis.AAC.20
MAAASATLATGSFRCPSNDNKNGHAGQHPAMKKVSIVDCGTSCEIIPNGSPVRIDNEFFSGQVMLLIRTPDVDDAKEPVPTGEIARQVSDYMKGYKRRFEFQFQIKFKKVPTGPLFLGCEVEEPIKVSKWTKGIAGFLLRMIGRINSGFHSSWGYDIAKNAHPELFRTGNYEKSHLSFPVEASMDRVVITHQRETPPELGHALNETPESVRRRRKMGFGSVGWNTEDTYTMCLWNAYMDWITWKTMNVPGCRPFPLTNVTGHLPVYLCVYELKDISAQDYKRKKPPHNQSNLRHYARMEFAHQDATRGGIAPRFRDNRTSNSCADTDSEVGSEDSNSRDVDPL